MSTTRRGPGRALARRVVALAAAGAVLGALVVATPTLGGMRDGAFGDGGIATVDLGGADRAVAGFLLPGGKVLLVGQTEGAAGRVRIALARLLPGGALDQDFGSDGRVVVEALPILEVGAAARGPDGKVVLLVRDADDRHALVQLLPDGELDPSFGSEGVVRTSSDSIFPGALAVQPDGRIVAGTDRLARYTTSGALDPSFGAGGVALRQYHAAAVALEPDGDILVFGPGGASVVGRRLRPDGRRDRRFGRRIDANAFVSVYPRFTLTGIPMDAAVGPRGRIHVGSLAGSDRGTFALDGLAVAFTSGGKPARGFHGDGWRSVDLGGIEWFASVAPLPDGRVLLAGTRRPRRRAASDAIVLAMLRPDGALQFRYGRRGKVVLPATPGREDPQALDLLIDGGHAIVVGEAGGDFLAVRYRLAP